VSPPSIAYVVKMFPRFSETFVLTELLELERQGVDLRIFSLKAPNDGIRHADVERLRASVVYLPESLAGLLGAQLAAVRAGGLSYLRLLARLLRRRRRASLKHFLQAGAISPQLGGVEHVHAHFASGATSVAMYLRELTGATYSFTAHAKDIYLDSVREDDLRRKLARARFAVTVSDFNVRRLKPVADGTPVVRIYNGLDLSLFAPVEHGRADPPLVLAVGRLIEKKGFDDLVRACAVLASAGTRFRCAIVGKGPDLIALRQLVSGLGLQRHVDLAGPLPREELLRLYPRATVFAAPCVVGADGNRDGLPTVLIEAMAMGVPVVATDVTGIPELVVDGDTGLLVPQRDPPKLAAALGRVLADDALGRRLARAGRAAVEERFDAHTNVGQLRRLLLEEAVV
jgi:colanic acid/amylovoran biosynthesis glycosyltransferase